VLDNVLKMRGTQRKNAKDNERKKAAISGLLWDGVKLAEHQRK
jgi:hypothetical protein